MLIQGMCYYTDSEESMHKHIASWAVIGAGPAGIIAVGKLLDIGINPKEILWIDPEFKVGDFGKHWRNVVSNTNVWGFIKLFYACNAFKFGSAPDFEINKRDLFGSCRLALVADPLQWISDHLKSTVNSIYGMVSNLKMCDRHWHINLENIQLKSKNVVLAIGAEPKSLSFANVEEIPLKVALDSHKLERVCNQEDTIGIFGSSHSAILILKTLLEKCNVKKVLNFYLSPLRYQVKFDDGILFADTGLKAETAAWARANIDGKLPEKLERILSNKVNLQKTLPLCSKVIYAIGFEKRNIKVHGIEKLEYHPKTGIIAPGLFGFGIAFPQAQTDHYGTLEYRVGLGKFYYYLTHILPIWMSYGA